MGKPVFKKDIFLSFYGDDFTGSTDVMEVLSLNGIPTALFLNAPEKQEVEAFRLKAGVGSEDCSGKIRAFGVAGVSRSLTPTGMDRELPGIFEKIRSTPADFFHYKICSTFDSSVKTGNIGHAVELALRSFPSAFIPLVVGAPFLNRFVAFGNLFARVNNTTYRLDRHPTMSRHPVTPMTESDLGAHLSKQTSRSIRLMDKFALEGAYGDPGRYLGRLTEKSGNFVSFDTIDNSHLKTIGRLLVEAAPALLVGSSGVELALALYLQHLKKIKKVEQSATPGSRQDLVVMAGSAAPGTAEQVVHMESLGHKTIRINTLNLVNETKRGPEIDLLIKSALQSLERRQVPVLYSAMGPDDPAIAKTNQYLADNGFDQKNTGKIIAGAQGDLLKEILNRTGKLRVVVAGGDTAGYVSRTLGIYALEILCPIAPGAPLCVAHSKDTRFDGLEIALKGGQNGNKKYFESILAGKSLN